MGNVRIDHAVVSGTFSLDGEVHQVDNNIWVLGNDAQCVVIDAPHDVSAIEQVVGDRKVLAILCTHAHDDHVRVAPEAGDRFEAPVLLHPDDAELWSLTHGDVEPDGALADGDVYEVAGVKLEVLHTPGHSPGACCFYVPKLRTVFTGDTLFKGGPGATGRSFSSRDVLEDSIRRQLFPLDDETRVLPGHGEPTTIGAEAELLGN
ncbi:MBL fold metallo-hydrolase [Luteococcus peritonei]|uniref:MBL fold metallo-hydrolase n=1 Tax=Luteococcus peritonei TaxID=88874 RepID=A0ABW4RWH2_9ACTN